jgi:hypothetical protein
MRYFFLITVASMGLAQSPLTTPVLILPKADHSAAGEIDLYDQNKANFLQLQYNVFTAPDLADGLILRDFSGTTTGHALALETNGGTPYFYIFGGTDATAPGREIANGGIGITPFSASFPAIVVTQAQANTGIEVDITGAGLSAFYGTSTATAATLLMTNSHSGGTAAEFSGAIALNFGGELKPATSLTYSIGDPSDFVLDVYTVFIDGPSHVIESSASIYPSGSGLLLGRAATPWSGLNALGVNGELLGMVDAAFTIRNQWGYNTSTTNIDLLNTSASAIASFTQAGSLILTGLAGSGATIVCVNNSGLLLLTGCSGGGGSVSITASGPVVASPSTITGTGVLSCPTCLTTSSLSGTSPIVYSSGVISCPTCLTGTNYWSLSGSNLTPISNYNVNPLSDGTSTQGVSGDRWLTEYTYTLNVGSSLVNFVLGNGTTSPCPGTCSIIAEAGTPIMGWYGGAFAQTILYGGMVPNISNTQSIGTTTNVFANVYGENLWSVGAVVTEAEYAVGPFGGPYSFGVTKTCTTFPTVVGGIVTAC